MYLYYFYPYPVLSIPKHEVFTDQVIIGNFAQEVKLLFSGIPKPIFCNFHHRFKIGEGGCTSGSSCGNCAG